MEATPGISLYSYFYLKLAKTVFLIISYVFSKTKSENKRQNRFCPERGRWGSWPK
jgi:hypothetical protein